jgi:predicted ester cyclase
MTRLEIVGFLQRRQGHWTAHDAVALANDHSPDGIVHSPIFGVIQGRDAIEGSYRNLFTSFADWDLDPQDLIVEGDRAVQMFRATATHTSDLFGVSATNRRFEIRGALIFDFINHKITRERRLYDFTSLLLQLGILKAKPRD